MFPVFFEVQMENTLSIYRKKINSTFTVNSRIVPVKNKAQKTAKITTLYIVQVATMVALNVVIKMLSVPLTPSFQLSFAYIVCWVSGIFLGPAAGLIVGVLGDIFGVLIRGSTIIPIVTLGGGMIGVIAGLCFYLPVISITTKTVFTTLLTLLIVTLGINSAGLYLQYYSSTNYWQFMIFNRLPQIPLVLINGIISLPIIVRLNKEFFKKF